MREMDNRGEVVNTDKVAACECCGATPDRLYLFSAHMSDKIHAACKFCWKSRGAVVITNPGLDPDHNPIIKTINAGFNTLLEELDERFRKDS